MTKDKLVNELAETLSFYCVNGDLTHMQSENTLSEYFNKPVRLDDELKESIAVRSQEWFNALDDNGFDTELSDKYMHDIKTEIECFIVRIEKK